MSQLLLMVRSEHTQTRTHAYLRESNFKKPGAHAPGLTKLDCICVTMHSFIMSQSLHDCIEIN